MTRILVTGGAGFIGSHFIRTLLQSENQSYDIVNLDALSYGADLRNLASVDRLAGYRFVKGSTTDELVVKKCTEDVDIIVNFAAETHVDRSIANPYVFFASNAAGTTTLLESARKGDIMFVQISTDEVYGPALHDRHFTEEDKLTPSSPYAASKGAADLMVESYHRTYGLHTVILRCTNNFGPYQFPEKFIPKTIISSIIGQRVPIYGNGMQIRDWIYVRDFCHAIELAMKTKVFGGIYNVSAGNELPNLDVAKLMLRKLNKPEAMLQFVENRPGHDARYSLDSTKIRNEFVWRPTVSFNEALNETIEWYVKNAEWWKPHVSDRVLSPTPWKETWENEGR